MAAENKKNAISMSIISHVKSARGRNSDHFKIGAVVLSFGVLFCLFFFTQQGQSGNQFFYTISNWNWKVTPMIDYGIAGVLYLTCIGFFYFLNPRTKKILMVIASVGLAQFLYGSFSFSLFIAAYLFYEVTYIKIRSFLKVIFLAVLYEFFLFISLEAFYGHDYFFWYCLIFSALFPLRFIFYFYHVQGNGFKRESLIEYFLYIFCPVYFIILPHVVILPNYRYFRDSFAEKKEDFMRSVQQGVKAFAFGLWQLAICILIDRAYHAVSASITVFTPIEVIIEGICLVLMISGYGYLLLGLVRGLGYNIKAPFNNPLKSRNIIDFFDRFIIYFKEYIMVLFFMPLVMMFRFLNQYVRVFVAAAIAVLAGSVVYFLVSLGNQFCTIIINDLRGVTNVSAVYAKEVQYSMAVTYVNLHYQTCLISVRYSVMAVILGLQLVYNQMLLSPAGRFSAIKKISGNPFIKFLQIAIMALIFAYIFLL